MRKTTKNKFVMGIVIVIALIVIYQFPIQRYLAIKNAKEYMKLQGTGMDNVKSMNVIKNYKQDGYYVDIVFKDDPEFLYTYRFKPSLSIFEMLSHKSIRCTIWDEKNVSVDLTGKIKDVKYLPLDEKQFKEI